MSDEKFQGRDFDQAARDFERLGHYLWQPIGQATVDRTQPQPGERVLDACCGNGASALPTATLVGASGSVDAVDLSESLLAQLRSKAEDLEQLSVHRADVTAWEPEGYDLVQCVLGIFFPDMVAGTRHLITRRGGHPRDRRDHAYGHGGQAVTVVRSVDASRVRHG